MPSTPGLGEGDERDQRRLRRVRGADADPLAAQVRDLADRAVRAHEHDARQIAVGVAHRDRLGACGRAPRAARSASIQASGEFHATSMSPREVRLDLALVVRVQDEVERQARALRRACESPPRS